MVAYRFYLRDPGKGAKLIGILAERRKDPARISPESVMNWGKKYFGETLGMDNIFFVQVKVDTSIGRLYSNPIFPS
jgi:hypothetical protein